MSSRRALFALVIAVSVGACGQPAPTVPAETASTPAPGPGLEAVDRFIPAMPPARPGMFVDIASATGIDFEHFTGATGRNYFPEIMGAGCVLFDYDNDGDLDVYLIQGSLLERGRE